MGRGCPLGRGRSRDSFGGSTQVAADRDSNAVDVYSDFVVSLLDIEAVRKSSLEQRGTGLVTTSGALITLLFGLTTFLEGAKSFRIPPESHVWLIVAIFLFALSSVAGIAVNVPQLSYPLIKNLRESIAEGLNDTHIEAKQAVMDYRLKRLSASRRANNIKGWLLISAGAVELLAIIMLAIGVFFVIQGR
jgi:hypothetical protein